MWNCHLLSKIIIISISEGYCIYYFIESHTGFLLAKIIPDINDEDGANDYNDDDDDDDDDGDDDVDDNNDDYDEYSNKQ